MIIRTIALTGSAKQIIPPDAAERSGAIAYTILNNVTGNAAATLLDDQAGDNSIALPAGAVPFRLDCEPGETLWATGTGNIGVIGTPIPVTY